MRLPEIVAHADWSTVARKRVLTVARRQLDGVYRVELPRAGWGTQAFLAWLYDATPGSLLLGVDFPIGLPEPYAGRVGVSDFPSLLPKLGQGQWADFYRVAVRPAEISLGRPFYPDRPGGSRRRHLLDGLGLNSFDELYRRCDRARAGRRAAAPLFWTLGPQQVGKAAISGWRDVLAPLLTDPALTCTVWPFHGDLPALLTHGSIVVAETYPAECYLHLGLSFPPGSGKRSQAGRAENGARLLTHAEINGLELPHRLKEMLKGGFGPESSAEDAFDSVVGLWGMVNVLRGRRAPGAPGGPQVRQIEGWILGQSDEDLSA